VCVPVLCALVGYKLFDLASSLPYCFLGIITNNYYPVDTFSVFVSLRNKIFSCLSQTMPIKFIKWFYAALLFAHQPHLECSIKSTYSLNIHARCVLPLRYHDQQREASDRRSLRILLRLRGGMSAFVRNQFKMSESSDSSLKDLSIPDQVKAFSDEQAEIQMSDELEDAMVFAHKDGGDSASVSVSQPADDTYFERPGEKKKSRKGMSDDPFWTPRRRKSGKRGRNSTTFSKGSLEPARAHRDSGEEENEAPEFSWGLSSDDDGRGGTDGRLALERLADRVYEKTGSPVFRLESGGVLTVPRSVSSEAVALHDIHICSTA
jgi:hypothetical protein